MIKDTRIDDNYNKFMLENKMKEEMERRKTQYHKKQATWSIVLDTVVAVLLFAIVGGLFMLIMPD